MIWHLIAAICAALAGAGIALILRSLSRKWLPKWIIPVFAGLGMLGYTIHYEYTWFAPKAERLPAGSVVVDSEAGEMMWRPWTYQFPIPLSYTVLDNAGAVVHDTPNGRVARFVLYRFEKHSLISTVTSQSYQLLCRERAMFQLNDKGEARFDSLRELSVESQLYRVLCAGDRPQAAAAR